MDAIQAGKFYLLSSGNDYDRLVVHDVVCFFVLRMSDVIGLSLFSCSVSSHFQAHNLCSRPILPRRSEFVRLPGAALILEVLRDRVCVCVYMLAKTISVMMIVTCSGMHIGEAHNKHKNKKNGV